MSIIHDPDNCDNTCPICLGTYNDRNFDNKEYWEWHFSNYGLEYLVLDYATAKANQYETPKYKASAMSDAIFHILIMSCNSVYSPNIYNILKKAEAQARLSIEKTYEEIESDNQNKLGNQEQLGN